MRARCSAGCRCRCRHLGDDLLAFDPGGDGQPAAARHRVARVQQQVEEDLLQLELVSRATTRAGGQLAPDLDVALLELVLEQRQHVADDGVDVDRCALRRRGVGPRQVEQAVDDRAARNVCFSIFSRIRVSDRPDRRLLEQHLRVARDAGERRVHFVRDAGREQAERRHLLGNAQLLLEVRALGDVLDDDDVARRSTVLPARRCSGTIVMFTSSCARRGAARLPAAPDNSDAPSGDRARARRASTNARRTADRACALRVDGGQTRRCRASAGSSE